LTPNFLEGQKSKSTNGKSKTQKPGQKPGHPLFLGTEKESQGMGMPRTHLLSPVKDSLLGQIEIKPGQASPHPMPWLLLWVSWLLLASPEAAGKELSHSDERNRTGRSGRVIARPKDPMTPTVTIWKIVLPQPPTPTRCRCIAVLHHLHTG